MVKIKRALISVYDKNGLDEFVKELHGMNVEIISTGGTADFISSLEIPIKRVEELTGFPEILEGRVKTLHPKVHGALLSLRESHEHMRQVRLHNIELIDMVVVNLYPFKDAISKPDAKIKDALENIDIGGVSLLRSAAKNYSSVAVICSSDMYKPVLEEMKAARGLISDGTLSRLSVEAFKLTAEYDALIEGFLRQKLMPGSIKEQEEAPKEPQPPTPAQPPTQTQPPMPAQPPAQPQPPTPAQPPAQAQPPAPAQPPAQAQPPTQPQQPQPSRQPQAPMQAKEIEFPPTLNINVKKSLDLRYGENPHQQAAFYKEQEAYEPSVSNASQLLGRQLSYNNILDLNAALEIVKEFEEPAACIVKHTNPCGAATGETIARAYTDALDCDRMSAFGGIIGLNRDVDIATADAILSSGFLECIIAPAYNDVALEHLKAKEKLRILSVSSFEKGRDQNELCLRKVVGGLLAQKRDLEDLDKTQLKIVSRTKPTADEVDSLLFAWKIVKHISSNAIVLAKGTKTVGIGAGQMSRVDSVFMAVHKAGRNTKGSVLASDAFFPKVDAIETAAKAGVSAIIQPGGSKSDEEMIKAADRFRICMVFTGIRHFRH